MASSRELIIGIRTKDASKASKDIKDIEKSIKGAEKSTKGFKKETDGAKKSLFSLAGAGKGLQELGGKISALGGKIKGFGNKVSKAMLPLAGALLGGYKMFMDLDTSIRKVSTLTKKEVLPISQIRKETRRISDMSGIAQKEIAESMYDALSSGVDPRKVVGFTESAVKLTKAGFTDMGTAIDSTTTVLNAYGKEADSVSKIHDIFVKTQDLGKITVDQLGQSIGRVIPIAASSGVKLNQLGATYAILTARGIEAAQSTTAINSLLAELSSTGTKADKTLRQATGKSFVQLTKDGKNLGEVLKILEDSAKKSGLSLNDMFGNINATKAATSLATAGVEEYNRVLGQMNNSTGSVDANFNAMAGPAEKLNKATNRLKNNLIDLGGQASPYIEQLADGVSKLSEKLGNMDGDTMSTIAQWGLLLVAAGPLISIFGTIISVIGTAVTVGGFLIQGFGILASTAGILGEGLIFIVTAGGPIVWIFALIAGVAIWLAVHFQSIKQRADELGGGMGWLKAILEEVKASFHSLGSKALGVLESIKAKWQEVKEFLKHPIQGIINLVTHGGGNVAAAGRGGRAARANSRVARGRPRVASHATGLNYVPYDNYLANLHKGETILTAKASEEYRALGGDKDRVPKMVNNTTNDNSRINNSYQENHDNQFDNTNNAAPIINNYYTIQGDNPRDIALEVEKTFENMFRNLRLQRV